MIVCLKCNGRGETTCGACGGDGFLGESCGNCQHANREDYDDPTLVSCTNAASFYHGHAMQHDAKCRDWTAK